MSFDIARNINGPHTLTGGPAGDGVFFGALAPEDLPNMLLSRVLVAGSFQRVVVRDASGAVVTYNDETVDAGTLAGTVPWPNSTSPINDRLLLGVPAGRSIKGLMMLLDTPANWTDSGLDWSLSYPTASALTALPHNASTSSAATVLRTGSNGTLITINFNAPLSTDLIAAQPYGGTDAYERRIELGLTGTITGSSVFPLISRIWPVWDLTESMAYYDFTEIMQPMSGVPDYSLWPTQIVARAGDESLLGCHEWPVAMRWIVDQVSGTTGAATYRYSSTTGMKDLPAEFVNDPSDWGRAGIGTYQLRVARPADAAKMWVLTYTLAGNRNTIFTVAEPLLPVGAVLVRKVQTYLFGRKFNQDSVGLVSAFRVRFGCRELDPAFTTSTLSIMTGDPLKFAAVEAEESTGAAGESSWFLANRRTGHGVLIRDTLTLTNTAMSASDLSLTRQAGDGFILVKIRDKATANAEAQGGELVIAG